VGVRSGVSGKMQLLIGQHGNGPVMYKTWTYDRWTVDT